MSVSRYSKQCSSHVKRSHLPRKAALYYCVVKNAAVQRGMSSHFAESLFATCGVTEANMNEDQLKGGARGHVPSRIKSTNLPAIYTCGHTALPTIAVLHVRKPSTNMYMY